MEITSRDIFEFQGFVAVAHLDMRGIYLVFTDPTKFDNYEGYVYANELRVHFVLEEIYKLICESLQGSDGYNVQCRVIDSMMELDFHLLVGGILKVHFDVHLTKKALNKKGFALLSVHKTEVMTKRFKYMEAKLSALESDHERLLLDMMALEDKSTAQEKRLAMVEETWSTKPHSINIVKKGCFPQSVSFDVDELHLDQAIQTYKIPLLRCLPRLRSLSFWGQLMEDIKSESLEELYIREGNFLVVKNLNLSHLPRLKVLHLIRPNGLTDLVQSLAESKLHILVIEQCPESIDIEELRARYAHRMTLHFT